jgi:hypothetical protein
MSDDSQKMGWLNPPPAPSAVPDIAQEAVFAIPEECKMPEGTPTIKGYDFNQGVDIHKLLDSFTTMGFQGSNLGLAIEEIRRMVGGCDCEGRQTTQLTDLSCFVYSELGA